MTGVLKKAIYLILLFFMALLIASSFFIRAKYNYAAYGDTPILEKQQLGIMIPLAVAILAGSAGLYKMGLKLNKFSPKAVIPVTLLISFGIQLAILLAFPLVPTADSQTVWTLASNMLHKHDYSSFQPGGYLYMFPYNFSIVLYLKALLALFPDSYMTAKIANLFFTLATTLMIYLIYKELNPKSSGHDYGVLFFGAAYGPALFMNNYIYNDVVGTALLTAAIFFVLRFVRTQSIKAIAGASILLALGNYFRSIGVIILIAAVLYILMNVRQLRGKKAAAAIGILLLLFPIPSWTQNAALQSTGIVKESVNRNSAPVYMWLHMGINKTTFGFWDNSQSYNIYQRQANYNKEKSTELFKAAIAKKVSGMTTSELLQMYYKKLVWTWTEGTYQMERYGIGTENTANPGQRMRRPIMGGYSYTTSATDLFKGDSKSRSAVLWLFYVVNVVMYGLILFRLIRGIRGKRYEELFLNLVILGFMGFYLLWEIKSRYLFPVYPLLIVIAYMGFKELYEWLAQKRPFVRS